MTKKFRTRDPEGLYIPLQLTAVVSCSAHAEAVAKGLPILAAQHGEKSKIYTQAKEALDFAAQLPTATMFVRSIGPADTPMHTPDIGKPAFGPSVYGTAQAYIWHKPERSTGSAAQSYHVDHDCANAIDAGWTLVFEIAKREAAFDAVLLAVKCSTSHSGWSSGAASLMKKAKALNFVPASNTSEMEEVDTYVVMIPNGFADKDGRAVALGSARSFESAPAAKRWCGAKGFSHWKILRSKTSIQEVLDFPGDTHMDAASAAIASREARELKALFERADLDMLRERVAELEAAQGIKQSSPTEAPVKKRL